MNAQTARVLARAPLGAAAEQRYGAPYWVIHRGDLQAVLIDAVGRQSRHRPSARHAGSRTSRSTSNGVTVAALTRRAPGRGARHAR